MSPVNVFVVWVLTFLSILFCPLRSFSEPVKVKLGNDRCDGYCGRAEGWVFESCPPGQVVIGLEWSSNKHFSTAYWPTNKLRIICAAVTPEGKWVLKVPAENSRAKVCQKNHAAYAFKVTKNYIGIFLFQLRCRPLAGGGKLDVMAETEELEEFSVSFGSALDWAECPGGTMFHAIHFFARTGWEDTFSLEKVNSIYIVNFVCENYQSATPLPDTCQPANPNPIHTENILLPALAVAADNTIKQITFSPDGQKLLVTDGDSAKLWDLNNLNPAETQSPVAVLPSSEAVNHGAISLDNQKAVTVDSSNTLKLWNLANLTFENAVPQPELLDSIQLQGEPWQAAFDPDGKRLVVVGNFTFAELYGISEGNNGTDINHLTHLTHLPHPDNVVYAAFSPDNAFLVTATDYPAARYWELGRQPLSNEGERTLPLHAFMQPDFYIPENAYLLTETSDHPVAYSPSGRYLVTLLYQMGLVWDLEDQYRNYLGEPRSSLLATAWHNQHDQYDYIVFATFASSDQYLLTASTDKTARLWDISQLSYSKNVDRVVPELLAVLEHEDSVVYADFHPDKNYVVTASSNTVKLWNLNTIRCSSQNHLTPELLATLPHEAPVQQVVFDPGKKFLVSISSDNKWFLWDISGLLSQSSNEEL